MLNRTFFIVIERHIISVLHPFSFKSFCKILLRTENEPESVLWVYTFANHGSIPGDVPAQIIEIEAVGATAVLCENLS